MIILGFLFHDELACLYPLGQIRAELFDLLVILKERVIMLELEEILNEFIFLNVIKVLLHREEVIILVIDKGEEV